MKSKKQTKKEQVKPKRKTSPRIVLTALAALGFIGLAFWLHWAFILPAVLLWWMNKKYIKNHFSG